MAAAVPICPTCGSVDLRPHCESRTCDWVRCRSCEAWGRDDFSRWVEKKKAGGF